MGNGAKAAQKRERKAKDKPSQKNPKKGNENPITINCATCKQPFPVTTTRMPALEEHVANKHPSKTVADCFPDYKDPAK